MPRVGLVLGAGGVVGHAFSAGVLRALHETTGWDPREAEIIVGTSSGAHVGALLRAGLSPADLAARVAGEPLSDDGAALLDRIGPAETVPPPRTRAFGMSSPGLLVRAAVRPWSARLGTLVAAALPRGRISLDAFAARIRWIFGEEWTDYPLWVCAVRLRDGQRVVFGRGDAPVTDLGSAVAASCAVPGWFGPVRIGQEQYVDGGTRSPTNLDVLAGQGLDLVVVVSPMSVVKGSWHLESVLAARTSLRWVLAGEARKVRRAGTPVVAFQPTSADVAVMGLNAMDHDRGYVVARRAYASAGERLTLTGTRERLSALAS